MSEMVRVSITNGVAVITIDNPPVNALSPGVPEGISNGIDKAARDAAVSAVVIIGAGRTFIAGADIKQLEDHAHGRSSSAPNLHDLLKKIEDMQWEQAYEVQKLVAEKKQELLKAEAAKPTTTTQESKKNKKKK